MNNSHPKLKVLNIPANSLTREQVRDVDRCAIDDYGMLGLVLMENAGRNAAELLKQLGISGPVAICCGKGNNGGDGFVIARHLENSGVDVRVLLCGSPNGLSGDAATNFEILKHARTSIAVPPFDWDAELSKADWIVDALLGTGTQGLIREPFASAINSINQTKCNVFAVDLPSGLDCNAGLPLGADHPRQNENESSMPSQFANLPTCVRANHTATFVARKVGFDVPGSEVWTGQVHVIDIGVPKRLLGEIHSNRESS